MRSLHPKDPCHCGSGKKFKHCHMSQEKAKSRNFYLLILLPSLAVLVIGLALWTRRPGGATGLAPSASGSAAPAASASHASADQSPLPDGATPVPWQHDAPRNRHWNAAHGHWHEGPPPPEEQRVETATANRTSRETNTTIPNPEPWQYDPTTNQHYDPNHRHWHSGPAPSPDKRTTASATPQSRPAVGNANIPNPQPWQYDALSNRHYNPDHGHWHSGPPPADRSSGAQSSVRISPPTITINPPDSAR